MRSKAKLIVPLALVVAVAAAGLSLAAGGSDKGSDSSTSAKAAPTAFVANGAGERNRRDGGVHRRFSPDADVRAVHEDIREAVADQAPAIAGPVIDKAESDDKITAAQAEALRKAAQDIADGKRPSLRDIGDDADVREVVHDAFAAAAKKAPAIAEPIIDKAVGDKKITSAQADRIREMLKRGPAGRGGFGKRHGPGGGPPAPFGDADVRAVLEDVHEAVAKQAPAIAGPVIDKAQKDGKITEAQADALRKAAQDFVGRKPRGGPPKGLNLRDSDVREVLGDIFAAVAAKTPGIAKPIVDKAVDEDKVTAAQARKLTEFLTHARRGGPHKMGHGRGHGPKAFGRGGSPPERPSAAPEAPVAPGTSS